MGGCLFPDLLLPVPFPYLKAKRSKFNYLRTPDSLPNTNAYEAKCTEFQECQPSGGKYHA